MILETKNKNIEQYSDSLGKGTFKVRSEDMALMFETIRSGMYSNPIGSIVREIASNCLDATRERDLNTDSNLVKWLSNVPNFDIEYTNKNVITGSFESIVFRDYGIGLSPERIEDTYKCLFNSSKRLNNNQIGGFGIGSKSPFSYTEEFYIQTKYCGTEYLYLVFIDESNLGSIDLIQSKSTEECNGTEIIIPVKSRYDKDTFVKEIELQLAYIENKTIKGLDVKQGKIIFEDDLLIKSSIDRFKKPHLYIGGIAYPIDSNQVESDWFTKWNSYDIALKIGIGEVDLTPSRESLRYTDKTKKYINVLLEKVDIKRNELVTETAPVFNHYFDYVRYYDNIFDGGKVLNSNANDNQTSLYHYQKFTGSNFKPTDYKLELNSSEYELSYYNFEALCSVNFLLEKTTTYGGKVSHSNNKFDSSLLSSENKTPIYFKIEKKQYKKNLYLIEVSPTGNFLTLSSAAKIADQAIDGTITQNANELHEYFLSWFETNLPSYEDVIVDESKITKQLEDDSLGMSAAKLRKQNQKIFYKEAIDSNGRWQEVKCEFKQSEIKVSDLEDSKDKIKYIFGFKEDDLTLKACYSMLESMELLKSYKVIKIAKDIEEHFQDCIYISEIFMNNEDNLIANWYTGCKLSGKLGKYDWLEEFEDINKDLYTKFIGLEKLTSRSYRFEDKIYIDFRKSLFEHLEKTNCYNQADLDMFKEIESYGENLEIFEYLDSRVSTDKKQSFKDAIIKILDVFGKNYDKAITIVEEVSLVAEEDK